MKPIIQPQYKTPFAKREKLDKILDELEESGIIKQVEGPTNWLSYLKLRYPKQIPCKLEWILTWSRQTLPYEELDASFPPWKAEIRAERRLIFHQIRHATWLYANGTWPRLETHHHLLDAQRTATFMQVNFWNQHNCRSIPWRNEPNIGRYSQSQENIWRHTHIWEDRKGIQLSTNQSTIVSSGLWTYSKPSEMHFRRTASWIIRRYLLSRRCYIHPRQGKYFTQCHKTHHNHWS